MTRYVVVLFLLGLASPLEAQEADAWRDFFAAGQEALGAEDHPRYAEQMALAAAAMPDGHLNRPFAQYHAARAAALVGETEAAVSWLQLAWDEGIESLMISFARYDPSFDDLAESPPFLAVMGLAGNMELGVEPLGGSVYRLSGGGSNVVAQVGDDGVFLIDTGYLPALAALRRAIVSLQAGDVSRLLITHPHEDHMGAAAELGASATVLAHPGTTAAMDEPYVFMEGVEMPPKGATARPDVEIEADTSFVVNGEEVRVFATPAHTDGDLVVYFTASRVAHFGDTYLGGNPMMFPGQVDPDAFLDHIESAVDDMHPETVVVGGHEEPVTLAEIREQVEASRACMALVRESLEAGLTIEDAAASAEGVFPPQWVGFFYRLFSAG